MVGVPIDGPALLLGDNSSVVLNTSLPSSVLKKKHHACAYHRVGEAIAGNIMRFIHIPGTTNYADVLNKPLSNEAFHSLVKPLLFGRTCLKILSTDIFSCHVFTRMTVWERVLSEMMCSYLLYVNP
jgi:hypothetical protein